MDLIMNESESPVTMKRIEATEARFGISLPTEYKEFLIRNNGGQPNLRRFVAHHGERRIPSVIHWFLAIYDGEGDNFEEYFKTYKRRRARLPRHLVPIANDPGGNLICIAVSGSNVGCIYYWDHDYESPGEPTMDNVYFVASSFTEFLGQLSE